MNHSEISSGLWTRAQSWCRVLCAHVATVTPSKLKAGWRCDRGTEGV